YFSNAKAVALDENFIHREFEKVGSYDRVEKKMADEESGYLLGYLRFGSGTIQTDFFNEREKDHLIEVRRLFQQGNSLLTMGLIVFGAGIAALLVLHKRVKGLSKEELRVRIGKYVFDMKHFSVLVAVIVMLGALLANVIALLLTAALFNFETSFTVFHILSFERDTWMLDASDNLIKLFPEQFWADAAARVVTWSLLYTNALLILAIFLYRVTAKGTAVKD
ncbi:DUF1461 domain-containing protein, partial [Candidatus Woesearchaeota archaeon]|nr:DUF1461 domain-containing protein [Candidatus Woesearchaeota archaeon]